MIITGGKFKGKKLKVPKGDIVRPSSSLIKQSLFNILQNDIYDKVFVDIFAGSGSVAIEALSRGAKKAVLVERDRSVLGVLNANITALDIQAQTQVLIIDALKDLNRLKGINPDIIFVDPPYEIINKEFIVDFVRNIIDLDILMPEGLVVFQLPVKFNLEDIEIKGLELIKNKKYGKSRLLIWKKT